MGISLVPNSVTEITERALGSVASRTAGAARAVVVPPARATSLGRSVVDAGLSALDIPRRTRRVIRTTDRTIVELRNPDIDHVPRYVEHVRRELGSLDGVAWVDIAQTVGRVVVAHDEAVDESAIVAAVERAEAAADVAGAPLRLDRPDHPGDLQTGAKIAAGVLADAAGIGLGLTGRMVRAPSFTAQVDLAGLMTIASYVPAIRSRIDHASTSGLLDIGLIATRAALSGSAQSVGGPTFDIVHRLALFNAAESRRTVWEQRAGELCARPADLPVTALGPQPRRTPLPDGPIERLGRPTWAASVGGAGAALAVTRSLDRVIQVLVAGVPKAQIWGRQGLTAQLTRSFGDRNVLVMNPSALESLDRLDTVVIDLALLVRTTPGGVSEPVPLAGEIIAAAREARLAIWVAVDGSEDIPFDVDGTLVRDANLASRIERMQDDGHGVLYAGLRSDPACARADLSFVVHDPDAPTPWDADLIGTRDVGDVFLLLRAAGIAHVAARQTAHIALAGAGVGGLMAIGGVIPGSTRRIMSATDLAAVVAHVNATRHAVALGNLPIPPPPDATPYHAMTAHEVLLAVGSNRDGLSEDQAVERRPAPQPEPSRLETFARTVADEAVNPLTPILAAGAAVSAATGSPADAMLVGGVLGTNALVSGTQRFRAEQSLSRLNDSERYRVVVLRDGSKRMIDTDQLVRGDVIHVQAGEVVPADCRIVRTTGLEVDESSLTGESTPVLKHMEPCDRDTAVANRSSMLYASTIVAAGSAQAVVVSTGRSTEAYRGLVLGGRTDVGGGVEERLESITSMITPLSVLAGLGILANGLVRRQPMVDLLSTGVSLAVAAVPEGLPLLATVAQQSAARRLSAHGVIVRNPRAIETLGRIDTCCVDKTGTVTLGRLRVRAVSDGDLVESHDALTGRRVEVAATAVWATPRPRTRKKLPHPTDRAVRRLRKRIDRAEPERFDQLHFEPARGFHASLIEDGHGMQLAVKGAPEVVLPRCTSWLRDDEVPLDDRLRGDLEDHVDDLASEGLRILAVAGKALPDSPESIGDDDVTELTLVGFLGLKDPVRAEADHSIADLEAAGVRVVMLTGDHPATAVGIASELGISTDGHVITGVEIEALTDDQLRVRIPEINVCARVTPSHKVRIVRALQRNGSVVAMTGDGANDAAAIRLADVGVALGTRATEAARDASDIVVTDDTIETIVAAVVEGRALWRSVRDATAILVGGNVGEILFTLAGSLAAGRPPLNARQLLLVNLISDVAPAMAIAASPPPDMAPRQLLEEGPEQSLGEPLNRAIAVRAVATAAGTTAGWVAGRLTGRRRRASTVALASLLGTELGQTVAVAGRSPLVLGSSLASFGATAAIIQTPGLSHFFGCTPLGPIGWSQALGSAAAATVAAQYLDRLVQQTGVEFEGVLQRLRDVVGLDDS